MYVKLLRNLPIAPEHGAVEGRVFPCIRYNEEGRVRKAWFMGDTGIECAAYLLMECEIQETKEDV